MLRYQFLRAFRRQPLLDRAVERHEKHLVSLSERGLLVDVEDPRIEKHTGASGTWVVVCGRATMQSGIGIVYSIRLRAAREDRGVTVADQERSYSALIVGEGVALRYDSGHGSHNRHPHVHHAWPDAQKIDAPVLKLAKPVEINDFIGAIEKWRLEHAWRLPQLPPAITAIEMPR
jgi:hypothetical protein